jgi:hypothetical protein
MDILSSVEAGWATWADTIVSQDLDSLFFDGFICNKVIEVVGGKICDDATVGEFGFGSGWAGDGQLILSLD